MAKFKPASKIAARPQIKTVKQPIPRQVILPKKAQPIAKSPAMSLIESSLPSLPTQPNLNQVIPQPFNTQQPDINNPLFAGFSAINPMYSVPQPDVNNSLFIGFSTPYNPTSNYQQPDVNNPLFAGFSAINPMFNIQQPDVNNPLFAGFDIPYNQMYNYQQPNVNNPLFAGFSAVNPNINQQGFSSTGSFGNIESLLGKG